jgi:hypothetical protein
MMTFEYDDSTQSLIFYKDEMIDGIVTPFPDKDGALEWAQMVADKENNPIIEPDAETL